MKVKAPIVAECLANIEYRVIDTKMVKKYNRFILEAVKAWTNPKHKKRTFHAIDDGTFVADGKTFNLKRKMLKFKELL